MHPWQWVLLATASGGISLIVSTLAKWTWKGAVSDVKKQVTPSNGKTLAQLIEDLANRLEDHIRNHPA
jgi:hypothetical protein